MTLRHVARLVAEHAHASKRLYRLVGFTLIAAGVLLSSKVALAECPGNGCEMDEDCVSCPEDCGPCFDCSTLDCDDGDPCTLDECDEAGGCINGPVDCEDVECLTCPDDCGPCEDCLTLDCNDGDLCTTDECDPSVGCFNELVDCDDDDQCTLNSCDPKTGCQTAPVTCDDGEPCTDDGCDPSTGCIVEIATCDDGSECTVDSCDPQTGCVHKEKACDDGDPCTDDSCEPETGQCLASPKSCDDDDACTDEVCDPALGECIGTPKDCVDDDLCTDESCDTLDGCTYEPVDCNDGNLCTVSACEPASGCQYTALDCDDADLCTDDFCDPATGCFSEAVDCDDGNECSVDACDPNTGGCVYQPNCDEASCEATCECTWPEPVWTDVKLTVPKLGVTLPNSEAMCKMFGLEGSIAYHVTLAGSLKKQKFIGETPEEKCQDSTSGEVAFTRTLATCGLGLDKKFTIGGDVTDHLCPYCPPAPPSDREWQCLEAGYRTSYFEGEYKITPIKPPKKKITLADSVWVKLEVGFEVQGSPLDRVKVGLGYKRQLDVARDYAEERGLACPESQSCATGTFGLGGGVLAQGFVKGAILGWATVGGTASAGLKWNAEAVATVPLSSSASPDDSKEKCASPLCINGKLTFSFDIKGVVGLRWNWKRHPGGSFSMGASIGYTCEKKVTFLGCENEDDAPFTCPDPSYSKRGPFCCKWLYPWDACEERTCKQENRYCGKMSLRCSDGYQDCGGCDDGAECVDFSSLTNENKNYHDRLDRPNADIPPLPKDGTVCCRKRTCENLNPGPVDYDYSDDRHITPHPPTIPADGQAECGVFSNGCTDDKFVSGAGKGLLACGDCEEKNVGNDTNWSCSNGKCKCKPSDSCEENGWECGWHHTGCPDPENPDWPGTVYCGNPKNYGKSDYEAGFYGKELGCEPEHCCNEKKSRCYPLKGHNAPCGGKNWWYQCLSKMRESCGTVTFPSYCGENSTATCPVTPPPPYVCVEKPDEDGKKANFWACPDDQPDCVAKNSKLIYKRCQAGSTFFNSECVSFNDPVTDGAFNSGCWKIRDCSFGLSDEMIDCCKDDKSWEQCCSENPDLEGCP